MDKSKYTKIKKHIGIYQHKISKRYLATKRIKNRFFQESFDTIEEAISWRKRRRATIKEIWKKMQIEHFPTLALSTQQVWFRRYHLLRELENYSFDLLTPSLISKWIEKKVQYFKSDDYISQGRGHSSRSNLNNELNLLVTIFNWYTQQTQFEDQSKNLKSPVLPKHRKMGVIKDIDKKKKQIKVDDIFLFINYLKPLYRDLAMLQFYCAARISEIAGLQWSTVDIENRRMEIRFTSQWDMSSKKFIKLKNFPKNKEPRPVYITDEIQEILMRRLSFKLPANNFVFHVNGRPLNYGTIQLNYRNAQRKSGISHTGTHILRHGMAQLARQVGGLDAVLAMTGHKSLKLADYYSRVDEENQKTSSIAIMEFIKNRGQ